MVRSRGTTSISRRWEALAAASFQDSLGLFGFA